MSSEATALSLFEQSTEPTLPEKALSPMLAQYVSYKEQYPDTLLLFQVGDFYETFFEDAVTISRAINLTLTSRDKNSPEPIPMAGIPISTVDSYVERLVALGFSVAIVSQKAAPASGKGMFERALERVVTPGLRVLAGLDSSSAEALVMVILETSGDALGAQYCAVWGSAQQGTFEFAEQLHEEELWSLCSRVAPAEVITTKDSFIIRRLQRAPWGKRVALKLRGADAAHRKGVAPSVLAGLSADGKRACRVLAAHMESCAIDPAVVIKAVTAPRAANRQLRLDAATRANLELVANSIDGSARGTLLGVLDRTITPLGARALRHIVQEPLADVGSIRERHAAVRLFLQRPEERAAIRQMLRAVGDIERIAARVELLVGSPRELAALRDALVAIESMYHNTTLQLPPLVSLQPVWRPSMGELVTLLRQALLDTPAQTLTEGGIMASGYDAEVDALRSIRSSGTQWLEELERKERARTGIASLKIKSNGVLGYFYEVTKANLDKVPADFIRRQATANTDRFTTPELREKEREVLSAEGKLFARERVLFEQLRARIAPQMAEVRAVAATVALLDVLVSFAEVAEREGYIEPTVVAKRCIAIDQGRHPYVAQQLGASFVPNSVLLGDRTVAGSQVKIITGPNMGGKSTYLRQNALLVIMAQLGSFVPAQAATIGIVDRIFARLGASDNLHEGDSTFMVEMREAALIVREATDRSLVIIDELGRGTATKDGLSLACAVLEYLVSQSQALVLFATHFHELTALAQRFDAVGNLSVGVVRNEDDVVFTHHMVDGPAEQSYGIEVAKLAGLPAAVIERAEELLDQLLAVEQQQAAQSGGSKGLFMAVTKAAENQRQPALTKEQKQVLRTIAEAAVDDMTPRQALDLVAHCRQLLQTTSR